MKRVLFVSPHFPPSNAPDHQRIRMSLPYLAEFGWEADVLCIKAEHVAKPMDEDLAKSINQDIVHSQALTFNWLFKLLPLSGFSFRALYSLDRAADKLFKSSNYDVVYFSTTVFLVMILGPRWLKRFNVPFVVDIHDPWYTDYYQTHPEVSPPGGRFKFGLNNQIAKFLEPQVLRSASGVTSVSLAYLNDFSKRYPWVNNGNWAVIPFGASDLDFESAEKQSLPELTLDIEQSWCSTGRGGADLERALRILILALEKNTGNSSPKLLFVGTSYQAGEGARPSITPLMADSPLLSNVIEVPERVSHFQALKLLRSCEASILLGSDDPSYNPSKLANLIMARRPVVAVLRSESPAVPILEQYEGAVIAKFSPDDSDEEVASELCSKLDRVSHLGSKDLSIPENLLQNLDAKSQTEKLLGVLERAC